MKINERNYETKFTGKTLLLYKEEFDKDLFASLESKSKDTIFILQLIWVLVKTCDESFPSFKTWVDGLSMQDIANILNVDNIEEMTNLFLGNKIGTKKIKKN